MLKCKWVFYFIKLFRLKKIRLLEGDQPKIGTYIIVSLAFATALPKYLKLELSNNVIVSHNII